MQEFFEAWHFYGFNNYTLPFSVIMIGFEIVAGVAVLLGWRMKLFSWLLLLLIIFFSFLTGYAWLSGKIKECGCFGDCLPLSAAESFFKDLILLLLIIFLFVKRDKIKPLFSNTVSFAVLILSTVFALSLQWFALEQLPPVDCLPYKIGVNIPEKLKPPPGARPDSTVISFVYEKNGKRTEFTADKFPSDFDNSYKFLKRYDKLIRKGNSEPPIKDFALITESGNDSTQSLLTEKGYKIFLFAKELPEVDPDWNKEFSVILSFVKLKNLPVFLITANADQARAYREKNNLNDIVTILECDATAIKTAARANPELYLLKQGTILNKWSHVDFENAISEINELPVQGKGP
jgi:uncharacterized membrane protein YphA (DoxX/SURF4 family)